MALFGKREKAYEVWGDKPRWKEARQRLKDAGIKVMETGFYETEAPACGCGAKLDHRDFGPNGKIDRLTYYISVKPEDVERAKELLADLVKPEHVAPQSPELQKIRTRWGVCPGGSFFCKKRFDRTGKVLI